MAATPRPINIALHTMQQMFPAIATLQEMQAWFPAGIPANPVLAVVPSTATYAAEPNKVYRPASASIFNIPLPDTHTATNERERMWFIISHGDLAAFNPATNNFRSAVPNIEQLAAPNGVPHAAHWIWSLGRGNKGPDTNQAWERPVKQLLATANNDARGGMVKAGRGVWSSINHQNNPEWLQNTVVAGRMVSIMLYYLTTGTAAERVSMIKYCLGDRLRPTFDVDALYNNYFAGTVVAVRDAANNLVVTGTDANGNNVYDDLVPKLVHWIEMSCAHMLTECLNHHVRTSGRAATNMLSENFKVISGFYVHRLIFENNLAQFPYNG